VVVIPVPAWMTPPVLKTVRGSSLLMMVSAPFNEGNEFLII
jgi:hypothetical protein